jgi:tetratricopeptide (TPR) repeat protein
VANNKTRYEEALNQGHALSWDQRWENAIEAFKRAINEFPQEPAPYAGLGMAYFEQENLRDSLKNYKLAARYSKGDLIFLRHVADVQERLGQLSEAGQTYMAIGEIQLRRRMLDEAMDNWHRAVRLEPNLLGGHQRLATVFQRQGNVRAAIREYLAIARIFQNRNENVKALQTCKAALKLDPRNADVLTAIELIEHGEQGFLDEEPAPPLPTGTAQTVQRIATAFEQDVGDRDEDDDEEIASPVTEARRLALEQLAEELFEEESEDAEGAAEAGMSKLERDALISQALDYQTRGNVNEAIRCYERAIEGGISNPAVRFNLGLLYQDKVRFDAAIQQFEQVVDDEEYRLACHFSLGECYRAKGRIDLAVEHFITVLKIVDMGTVQEDQADQLIELYENLAQSLLSKGEPERATAFANALVEFLGNKGWEEHVREARERLDALSSEGRTMILGDILTAGSEEVLESLYLSQEFARRGMINTAMEETYRAIQLSPAYIPAHWQLGELLIRQNRNEVASRKFMTVGDTYRSRGDIYNAIGAYERVVNLNPVDVSTRARLISLLKQHGQIDRALHHMMEMGRAYYQLAQVDRAREMFQGGLKLSPRGSPEQKWHVSFLQEIAEIDMQRLDWRRALLAYRELRKTNPQDERIAMTLIELYHKVGYPQNGLRELDRYLIQLVKSGRGAKVQGIMEDMVRQRPNDPGLVERLSRLYLQQQRKEEAIALLDKLGEAQLEDSKLKEALITIERIIELQPPDTAMYRQLQSQLQARLA